ncbi:MAG: acyltransferase [Bacteroidetes bacterium]|nr:acyltransferase [Bacteroidota bacterium]
MKYIKQLDTLRAIAIIFVLMAHWLPKTNIIQRVTKDSIGGFGVHIFFVLSGFLISSILLNTRNQAEEIGLKKAMAFKNFYARRALRIFPIYYLLLLVLYIFRSNLDPYNSSFLYYFTYTTNFYIYNLKTWDVLLPQVWSLAVEEQFYLIWPWLILLINKKYLPQLIWCFIFIGIVSMWFFMDGRFGNILTFCCFDSFGLGALLAWYAVEKSEHLIKLYRLLSIIVIPMLCVMVFDLYFPEWGYINFRTSGSIVSMWMIAYIYINRDTEKLNRNFLLNNRILIFIGKISYGIYLYHSLMPTVINSHFLTTWLGPIVPNVVINMAKHYFGPFMLLKNITCVLLISWLSYEIIEKPFLKLKKYF